MITNASHLYILINDKKKQTAKLQYIAKTQTPIVCATMSCICEHHWRDQTAFPSGMISVLIGRCSKRFIYILSQTYNATRKGSDFCTTNWCRTLY